MGCEGCRLGGRPVALVVEGFLLFYDKGLCDSLHAKVWLEADCETCAGRRFKRSRRKKKMEDIEKTKHWFDRQVWPYFTANRGTQLQNAQDALRLDASGDPGDIFWEALEHCQALL